MFTLGPAFRYAGLSANWPTIVNDNIIVGNEGTSTTGWSVTSGSGTLSQAGSSVTFTTAAATPTVATLAFAGPTSNDYLLLIKAKAKYRSGDYSYFSLRDGVTSVIDIIFGYNYETSAAQLGTISSWNYAAGSGNNIITSVNYETTTQEICMHVDRNRSCVNLFYREAGTGKWDFCGSYAYSAGFGSFDDIRMALNGVAGNFISYDWLLYCRPNIVAIGDSICAGATLFNPNPATYGGEDDYDSTWMKHARIFGTLRNNLIVNKGIGSETSTVTAARIAEATAHQPRVVFLHASSNDEVASIPKATRSTNIATMLSSIAAAGATPVLLNAMYGTDAGADNTPTNDLRDYMLDWWNNYRPIDISPNVLQLDIMNPVLSSGFMNPALTQADGIHPTPAGYQAIGEYIGSFTTPVATNFANVTLLMNFGGADGSTTFTDLSSYAHTVTRSGNVEIDTSMGQAGLFDGTSDYLSIPHGAINELGLADFCIEGFVATSTALVMNLIAKRTGVDYAPYSLIVTAGGLLHMRFSYTGSNWDGNILSTSAINDGLIHHFAVTRSSGTVRLFVDGVLQATLAFNNTLLANTDPIYIGGNSLGSDSLNGRLFGLRVIKNEAVYVNNFVLPALPYPTA